MKKHSSRRKPDRRLPADKPAPLVTTPEGDRLVFCQARYRHENLAAILQLLRSADDFMVDPEPRDDGVWTVGWQQTGPGASRRLGPDERRILTILAVSATELTVDSISRPRLTACRQRLEPLLGDLIRPAYGAHRRKPRPSAEPPEPFIPPPEMRDAILEQMLRQWIDMPIPALDGLTPRQAAKTAAGRKRLNDLIAYIEEQQAAAGESPGIMSPDYRQALKLLGLE